MFHMCDVLKKIEYFVFFYCFQKKIVIVVSIIVVDFQQYQISKTVTWHQNFKELITVLF